MSLEELLQFLAADTMSDQQAILNLVYKRIGINQSQDITTTQKKIKILTMHGAKGLSGKIVFIPSVEQGIIPDLRSLAATGLLIEQRRLFYVSVTRAMACCMISHVAVRTGQAAMMLVRRPSVRLTRSQFLNEMGIVSINRNGGLTASEASAIVADVNNL